MICCYETLIKSCQRNLLVVYCELYIVVIGDKTVLPLPGAGGGWDGMTIPSKEVRSRTFPARFQIDGPFHRNFLRESGRLSAPRLKVLLPGMISVRHSIIDNCSSLEYLEHALPETNDLNHQPAEKNLREFSNKPAFITFRTNGDVCRPDYPATRDSGFHAPAASSAAGAENSRCRNRHRAEYCEHDPANDPYGEVVLARAKRA
jgi:hypothetical protein